MHVVLLQADGHGAASPACWSCACRPETQGCWLRGTVTGNHTEKEVLLELCPQTPETQAWWLRGTVTGNHTEKQMLLEAELMLWIWGDFEEVDSQNSGGWQGQQ